MTLTLSGARILALLKSLPAIRFALMLGGGVVSTALALLLILNLSWLVRWPESAAVERVRWLGIALAGSLAVNGIIMLALAWGKAGSVKLNLPGGVGAEIDFDEPHVPAPGGREL